MWGAGNKRQANGIIPASLAIAALLGLVFVLGSSSTEYDVGQTIDIKLGSTRFSETFTFTVGPLSLWRDHVLEFQEEYIQHSSVENSTNPLIIVNADLTVNGAEGEGFTHSIDAVQGGFGGGYQLILPQNLLHVGENNVTITYHIEVEDDIESASDIKLIYSGYRIKTSSIP
jgi:hypothetical protein